jgi:hypothetical protein
MNEELKIILQGLSKRITYRWRVQSKSKDGKKGMCSAYVSARDLQSLLDDNCVWESSYEVINDCVKCTLTIWIGSKGYSRSDFGDRIVMDKNDRMYEQGYKSAASEAFKRACVAWGASRFLYDIPMRSVPLNDRGFPVDDNGNSIYDLNEYFSRTVRSSIKSEVKPDVKPKATKELIDKLIALYQTGNKEQADQIAKNHELSPTQRNLLINARP